MEKILSEQVSLRAAVSSDCLLMFRLQHLDGKELDSSSSEEILKYKKYKSHFKPEKIKVIECDGVAIGRLRIVRTENIYIGGFQIFPNYRGQGIGSVILSNLINESERTNTPIMLEVFHENTEALMFYKKFGFKITKETVEQKIMTYAPQMV